MNDEPTYFTVDEANALLPDLERRFTVVLQVRARLRGLQGELEALGEPPTGETLRREGGALELVRARGRFRALVETLTEELSAVEALGVSIKDVEIGLCDFLGRRDGRDVWLCWQYGEKRVAFWHDLHSGFASRQPIEESRSSPLPRPPAVRIIH